jgi:hypothetical protein
MRRLMSSASVTIVESSNCRTKVDHPALNTEVMFELQLAGVCKPLDLGDESSVDAVEVSLGVLRSISVRPLPKRVNRGFALALMKCDP